MHRSELCRGDVIRVGHHAAVILEVMEEGAEVRDDLGQEGYLALPEEVLRSGLAGEGIYAHLALDD
jgi:hypothetical protein